MTQRLLALDLGTNCGWAVFDGPVRVASGTWNLKGGRYDNYGMRVLRLESALNEVAKGVELIAFEVVHRHLGTDAAHCYGALLGEVQRFCQNAGIACIGIPVGTVKKVATGKGNADKAAMMAAAHERFTLDRSTDDNEADALFVGVAALQELRRTA